MGDFLFVCHPDLAAISVYAISSGVLQQVADSPFAVGHGPVSMVIDAAEHFVYVANEADDTISVLAITSGTGALTQISGSPFTTGAATTTPTTGPAPTSLALDPSGNYLYVTSNAEANISAYALDSITGVPTLILNSPFAASTTPSFLVMDPSDTFLLEADQTAKSISTLPITAGTGALAGISSSTVVGSAPATIFITK
jgi:6-phosphogluconolactonase (cycloisomerase 2 family)